jgi:hypothetical protein
MNLRKKNALSNYKHKHQIIRDITNASWNPLDEWNHIMNVHIFHVELIINQNTIV